jgi:cation:H+ antiporter
MEYLIFIVAISALIYGADLVINQSEKIALHYNISHFVIGATLIALGTSLPEMAASMVASSQNKSDMAIANVLGSNIFNIGLVLGLVFLVAKNLNPTRDFFQKDSSWALFPIFVFILMSYDGIISRFEGVLFLVMMGAYIMFLLEDSKQLKNELDPNLVNEKFAWIPTIAMLIIGFVLVVGGANFTVESGSSIARSLGVSEWIIGLLLIALGTSLPELVVSVVAAKKGNVDMIIGNIIGSNVANFTVVLGAASLVNPLNSKGLEVFDLLAALILTLMIVFISANKIFNRSTGIVLLMVTALVVAKPFM